MSTDPFDDLRPLADLDAAVRPDPRFVARLRARIAAALTDDDGLPVVDLPERRTTVIEPTTERVTSTVTIQPYICVSPATEAIAWYGDVFEAVETIRYTGDDGRVGHAEISIGGAVVMLSDPHPEIGVVSPLELGGTATTLHLTVPDVDAVFSRAAAAGATIEREPADQPYGLRAMTLRDPFGHRWMVATPIGTPSTEEIQAATPDYTITTRSETDES
jgi:PhnB protein